MDVAYKMVTTSILYFGLWYFVYFLLICEKWKHFIVYRNNTLFLLQLPLEILAYIINPFLNEDRVVYFNRLDNKLKFSVFFSNQTFEPLHVQAYVGM